MQWNDTKEVGTNALRKIKENKDFLKMEILAWESETCSCRTRWDRRASPQFRMGVSFGKEQNFYRDKIFIGIKIPFLY